MPGFTQVFGGTTIAPAQATFLSLTMAADVDLAWPIEQAVNGNVVADTIEVNATAPGLNIDFPDARQVSTGYTTCLNNTGANTVTVRNAVGGNILSMVSGTTWVVYLADNSTEAGTWRVFQLGASVSVAVAAALAGAGLRAITTTLNQDIPVTSTAITPTTLIDGDRAKLINWTGGLGTFNLPTAGTVGNGWFIQIRNSGSGDLTVTPPSGTIDGAASKTFAAGTSAAVVTDGVNYYTLGFGSGSGGSGSFDFIEINVAGSGNFTLSGANLNRIAYRFVGVLTGNRTIIVPNSIQQYWIANATTGAFSLYVRTAGQTPPGIEVLQNNQNIMYCDGNNVIDAESSTVTFPIPVAQGGTGAVTAATARTNLGATATGDAVFTAASAAAARAALGATATGDAVFIAADAAAGRTALNAAVAGLPFSRDVGAASSTQASDAASVVRFTGVSSYTFTLDTDLPGGEVVTLMNLQNAGLPVTLQASGTLTWVNGSGGTAPIGNRTLQPAGIVTAWHVGGGTYYLLGGVGII